MQTLLEMWKASPWAFAIGMVVIAYAVTDTTDKAIRNLTRRSVRFTAENLDLLAKALADRLGEQPAKIDDAILDHLALKIADRMAELQADAAADDDMVAKLADAVRDRVNTVGLLACDIELIAARVMDLADERRVEREKARVEQAEAAARMEAYTKAEKDKRAQDLGFADHADMEAEEATYGPEYQARKAAAESAPATT